MYALFIVKFGLQILDNCNEIPLLPFYARWFLILPLFKFLSRYSSTPVENVGERQIIIIIITLKGNLRKEINFQRVGNFWSKYIRGRQREDRYCISMSKAEVRSSKLGLRFNCGIRRSLAVAPVESDPNYPRINRRKWNRIVPISTISSEKMFLSFARRGD